MRPPRAAVARSVAQSAQLSERARGCRAGTPAARCRRRDPGRPGSSSTVRNTATVRARSRYSSMSRFTNLAGWWRSGLVVQPAQTAGDALHGLVEGEDADLRADRRDLHRHVVDLGPPQVLEHRAGAGASASASPRMASPSTLTLRRMPCTCRASTWAANPSGSAGRTTPANSLPQPAHDERHHHAGEPGSGFGTGAQQPAVEPTGEAGDPPLGHEIVQPPGGAGRVADADDLVGEGQQEGLPRGGRRAAGPPGAVGGARSGCRSGGWRRGWRWPSPPHGTPVRCR